MNVDEKKYAIGVDYGTNSVRALVVNLADGRELGAAVSDYPTGDLGIILDPNQPTLARQSPRDYVDCFMVAVREAVNQAKTAESGFEPKDVAGIGVDTTGSTPIPVDADGVPLAFQEKFKDVPAANAWLWKDHTSIEEAEAITKRVHELKNGYLDKCGGIYSSEWYWAKIWHCLRENPEVFDAAYSWVELADFIPAYITGNMKPETLARGICPAGHKAMWDADHGGLPSAEFLGSLEPKLVKYLERYAKEVKSADQLAGYLTDEVAAKTGLAAGIPVAVGAFDCHMGAVGAGVKTGTLVRIVGTSACDITTLPLDAELQVIPGLCGIVPGSVLPDAYGIEAGQSAVGDIYRWFELSLAPAQYTVGGNTLYELEQDAATLLPGESGLVALDWNNGNRCILVDQALTGAIIGTTLSTSAAETYRALVEGTAYGARAIIERMEEYGVKIDEIVICGGIAEKSPTIMQIFADVWNRPLKISQSAQTCALGAALFGAVAGGAFADVHEAQDRIVAYKSTVYQPQPDAVAVYEKLYKIYKTLHDAFGVQGTRSELYPIMKELIAIRDSVRETRRQ
ncbi:MAG: ribulokinase [Thermoguttaceae bacterium]|jgi:L-ribulokinase|nr:ribulokinase [Thermoguttaceae bacterium]